jgi:hypothetical protein
VALEGKVEAEGARWGGGVRCGGETEGAMNSSGGRRRGCGGEAACGAEERRRGRCRRGERGAGRMRFCVGGMVSRVEGGGVGGGGE